jgi:4a-hydroxytetrahydrobiopterin dehydratase
MARLDDAAIEKALAGLSGWQREGQAIQKTYAFPDFKGSMAFVTKAALHAEAMDHHPDILVRYSRVTLTLSTHDAGGITEKDLTLARRIDGL